MWINFTERTEQMVVEEREGGAEREQEQGTEKASKKHKFAIREEQEQKQKTRLARAVPGIARRIYRPLPATNHRDDGQLDTVGQRIREPPTAAANHARRSCT